MKNFRTILGGVAILAIATGMAISAPAKADPISDFYKGRTVTFLVGYPPGGSYDTYARLVAQHMGKMIPGKPDIIVQNMPGGGGKKAAGWFYRKAPKDGTMLFFPPDAYPVAQLLDPKKIKYDAAGFTSIGSIVPVNPVVMARGGSPAKSIDEIRKTQINVACSGRGSQSFIMPAMMKHFLGFKLKLICGYKGSAPMTLALERGEVDAQSSAWISWRIRHADRITSGALIPIVQVGLARDKELPNLPLMQELTDDENIKQVLRFVSSGSAIGRSIAAPPGMPKDRIAAMRKAFNALMKDPAFLADAKKRRALIKPTSGEEIQAIVLKALATPKNLVEQAQIAWQQKTSKCKVNCKKKKKKKKK